jgi:hypothetical protein
VRKSVDVRGKEMRVVGVVMVGIRRSDAPLTSTDFVIKVSSLKPHSQSGVAEPSPPRGHMKTICPTSQPALNKRQLRDDDAPAQQSASQNLTPLNRKKPPPTLGRISAPFAVSGNKETVTPTRNNSPAGSGISSTTLTNLNTPHTPISH